MQQQSHEETLANQMETSPAFRHSLGPDRGLSGAAACLLPSDAGCISQQPADFYALSTEQHTGPFHEPQGASGFHFPNCSAYALCTSNQAKHSDNSLAHGCAPQAQTVVTPICCLSDPATRHSTSIGLSATTASFTTQQGGWAAPQLSADLTASNNDWNHLNYQDSRPWECISGPAWTVEPYTEGTLNPPQARQHAISNNGFNPFPQTSLYTTHGNQESGLMTRPPSANIFNRTHFDSSFISHGIHSKQSNSSSGGINSVDYEDTSSFASMSKSDVNDAVYPVSQDFWTQSQDYQEAPPVTDTAPTRTPNPVTGRFHCTRCIATFTCDRDRNRHATSVHGINQILHLCHVPGCSRSQGRGYSRADKLTEHMWKKHGDLGYRKAGM